MTPPSNVSLTSKTCCPVSIHLCLICKSLYLIVTRPIDSRDQVGALLTWNPAPGGKTTSILARVGVSLISSAQACSNAETEIPDFGFERVRADARKQWNDVLGRIQVDTTGVDVTTVQLFYSSVSLGWAFDGYSMLNGFWTAL